MEKLRTYAGYFGNEDTGGIPQCDEVFLRDLTANTETTITIPSGAKFAVFQQDVRALWVRFDGAALAAVPSGDLDNQTIMINPDLRYLGNHTTIRMISSNSGSVVVSFYG